MGFLAERKKIYSAAQFHHSLIEVGGKILQHFLLYSNGCFSCAEGSDRSAMQIFVVSNVL